MAIIKHNISIALCINPIYSHIKPALQLKRLLEMNGAIVTLIGFSKCRQELSDNIDFIELVATDDLEVKNAKKEKKYNIFEEKLHKLHSELSDIFSRKSFDYILVPISRFEYFYLPAMNSGAKILSYSTNCGETYINGYIPPTTSGYIPSGKLNYLNYIHWWKRMMRINTFSNWRVLKTVYPFCEMIKNEKMRFGIDGYSVEISNIVIGPKEFEFFEQTSSVHVGLLSNINKRNITETSPIIYCSLGTMANRYLRSKELIHTLIRIFERKDFEVVISLGRSLTLEEEMYIPNNIEIREFVNQEEMLSKATLVITHGGYGTVKECIAAEVPMLVFPSSYDQHGNAARVVYHKIGLRNNTLKKSLLERMTKKKIKRINEHLIETQIEELIHNSLYKNNISNMKKRIIANDGSSELLQLLGLVE